jgi:tRNA pseudouridine32 synthase / 23S rRNA pseudouridine746 synthase
VSGPTNGTRAERNSALSKQHGAPRSSRSETTPLMRARSERSPHPRIVSGAGSPADAGPYVSPRGGERVGVRGGLRSSLPDRVLYRDGLILVIDKPAGIAVHPGPGGGPDLESGFDALRFGLPHPPALAHRLDRDTSGCLVLGRHPKALRRLGALFADGKVEKIYWAIVDGHPPNEEGRIETGLKKLARGKGWRMVVDPAGQHAVTEYRVLGSDGGRAWLEFRPRTGRTHQIRVHCAALGCPVVGDLVYGRAGGGPLLLHARTIALPLHPAKPPIKVTAPPPPHMLSALARLGYDPREQPVGGNSE